MNEETYYDYLEVKNISTVNEIFIFLVLIKLT